MQEIHLHHPYLPEQIPQKGVVLVLGYFDGVHRAHQQVIRQGRKIADRKGLKLALMTFDKQPLLVFKKFDAGMLTSLSSPDLKCDWMAKLGVDYYYVVDFTSLFASLPPQEFVEQYMVGLNAKVVVAGFDYTYGPKNIANLSLLPKYARERFTIEAVPECKVQERKVSSTWIRDLLSQGNIEQANQLLGYFYVTEGVVVRGDSRGRTLDFPTANIEVSENVYLPGVGVYVNDIEVSGMKYRAMGSVGYNETFGKGKRLTVELNIFNFDQQIHGEKVKIYWLKYLRAQKKFTSAKDLVQQLNKDKKVSIAFQASQL
ncbi:MAG: riboflavin biosynthesis protein RibF [Streptococcaceae bacterium]|jgi:riboflavin kinase/FMN adenylyltransferase|nr:riboflavin biosynthesis protein RibF [Streptococcaceae bacterium]